MAAQKKNYTNQDIYKKLDSMDDRITAVENWQEKQEWTKTAVSEYIAQQASKDKDSIYANIKDLMPYIAALVIAASLILYAYASRAK